MKQWISASFPGDIAGASLKLLPPGHLCGIYPGFPGDIAGASLKPGPVEYRLADLLLFPR